MEAEIDTESERSRVTRRRRLLAGGLVALALAAGAVAAISLSGGESQARASLERFLAAYEAGDHAGAAALTDGRPGEVSAALEVNVEGLDGATLEAEVTAFEESGEQARATVAMRWEVPGIGEFAYDNPGVVIAGEGDQWLVRWSPQVVHPELDSGTRLGTERVAPPRASILDREGAELVKPRPVVEIGILPGRLDRATVNAAVDAVAAATEADPEALRRSLAAATSPDNFVPAITLREEEFAAVEDELGPIPGIEFGFRELPLAPTREFARALLGGVGPITAEQLDDLGSAYAVGDNVGQGGLQAAFEQRLAGTPDRAVVIRRGDGSVARSLLELEGEPGRALRTTLDAKVQGAAEAALGGTEDTVALIALEPSSGDLLAAASRPVDDAFNRGFEGQYPPGSTFKVVSTEALLAAGLDPDETVDCPQTIEVGGRFYRNFEGSAAGAVPFRVDFAESCNTAFVSLAERLEPEALAAAGELFGLGREIDPGVAAFSGDVPPNTDEVDQASSMIGQGRILVSPLAMAGVAATVVEGRWHAPRVLASDPRDQGPPLPGAELDELRSMMRDVITSGTGAALARVAGEPIGKSGTAEYGSGDPPPTHAWFIAGRADVAVAVLVEDAPSGGEFAAPIAADFLNRLGG
jgi:cell division protein FtsI/penicillin-binding protein 2